MNQFSKNRKPFPVVGKMALALCLAASITTPAAAFAAEASTQSTDVKDGLFVISSAISRSQVLDISGGATANCGNLQVWSGNATPAQRFSMTKGSDGYYTIKNVNSGKVLDVSGGQAKDGTNVQQYAANGTKAQKWSLIKNSDGTYTIKSALSSGNKTFVLDISGANSSNGGNLQIYSSNGTKAQKFNLESITPAVGNGEYAAVSSLGSRVADISGGGKGDCANLQLWDSNNTKAQRFTLSYDAKSGYYTIKNVNSGKVLDVSGGADANGANVQQYAANGTKAQKWAISKNSDGTLTIASATGGKVLDVSGGSNRNGANIQIWNSNGTKAQKWSMKSSTSTATTPEVASYQISFKYLDANGSWKTDTTTVKKGATPTAPSVSKSGTVSSDGKTFTFTGWDAAVSAATGNRTYTAQYNYTTNAAPTTPKSTTVTFNYIDEYGSWTSKTVTSQEGKKPTVPAVAKSGTTNSGDQTFTFVGWDSDILNSEQKSSYEAQYTYKNVEAKTYDVTLNFVTKEGGHATITTAYKQGQTPLKVENAQDMYINQEILLDTMTRDINETSKERYTFVGWDTPIVPVTGTATYNAQYKHEIGMLQNGTWNWIDMGTV